MPHTCSFPTGQVHPFKFKSPVWGVNRFVSPWLRFLLPWPVSRDGKWLLLCLGPWVVQHQCSHNRSGSPAHGPQGDGVPAYWRPRELGRSPASFPNTAPSDGRVTCYGNRITPRDAHSPTLGPCSTPVTESLLQPGAPPTSRRLPVWWPCSPTCHPCHTQGAQLTPSHWPPTLCHEVLPPAPTAFPGTSTLPRGPHVRPGRRTRRDRARAGWSCGRAAVPRWCPPAVTVPLPYLPSLSSLVRASSPPTRQTPSTSTFITDGFSAGQPRGLQTGLGLGRLVRKGMEASGRSCGSVGRS